ncbi:MAG: FAD-dependent oxidoreductase [Candidatus Paracaedibacteraceae bacterium]|nr:FAD-dependent oxidoreductase [Candidatus Paracaedibacteraceae bacterium]
MNSKTHNHIKLLKSKDKGIKKHIYIIGAGIAGLIAAYELKKLGHTVTILEGSDRLGGRVFTYRFREGADRPYGELGAMRFPVTHDYTLHYIHELQLNKKLNPFIGLFGNDHCFLNLKNNTFRIKDFLADDELPAQKIEILKEILGTFLPDDMAKLVQIIDLQDLSFYQRKNVPSTFVKLIEAFAQDLASINPSLISSLQYFLQGLNTEFFYLDGGMDQLPIAIASQLEGNIVYNAEVCKINNLKSKAELTFLHKEKLETISCDYVICTLPFTVLRHLSLQNFSAEKLEAIHRLKYVNACKILLFCKQRFWQDAYNIQGGASITDGVIRQIYYPLTRGNTGVLLNYIAGENANYLSSLLPQKRIIHAKEAIGLFHREIHEQGMILDSTSMAWDTHKWSKGGFCFMWTNDELTQAKINTSHSTQTNSKFDHLWQLYKTTIQPEGRIFFAGEHCSSHQGWIQGAIMSALETVSTIIAD